MLRLTTDKPTSEMEMYELAHNSCYAKDRAARYRDFDIDVDARDLLRKLMVSYGLWKSPEEYGLDADNEMVDDFIFDDTMHENLQYDLTNIEGLLAAFYRNLWALADLREILIQYEDANEQGLLIKLPCKVGDTVYILDRLNGRYGIIKCTVDEFATNARGEAYAILNGSHCLRRFKGESLDQFGVSAFLTKEEAEAKLKEYENEKQEK